jgi:heme ABC exporter ATP-binding subunit CcmA
LAVVTLRNAVCLLGRFPALAGSDLDVDAGEIVWLSGPNGAGKTTLLRLLAGLVPLHRGSAHVLGTDLMRDRRSHRRRLAFVGHETFAYEDLTVGENLEFAARAAGCDRVRALDAQQRFGLDPLVGVRHSGLSAGQRRRLALAAAFARDAELLLLDEPHAGLDAEARSLLDHELRRFVAAGRTVIFSSHEGERAVELDAREVRIVGGVARGADRVESMNA